MLRKTAHKSSTEISGDHFKPLVISDTHTVFDIATGARLLGGGKGDYSGYGLIEASAGVVGNTYDIDGTVSGASAGIVTFGADTTIHIGAHAAITGRFLTEGPKGGVGGIFTAGEDSAVSIARGADIFGSQGVTLTGDGSRVINDGHINASLIGISVGYLTDGIKTNDCAVTNDGLVEGMIGVLVVGNKTSLVNDADGEIIGSVGGVSLETKKAASVVNHGIVRALDGGEPSAVAAITLGNGDDKVVNDGQIYGHVVLGAGDDTIDTRGGSISGQIVGGLGSDTLITDNARYHLVEDPFALDDVDTVKSTVSYVLNNGVENLILLGKANIDATGSDYGNEIWGNAGNNRLTGLGGADIFHFGTHGGTDTIADLETGIDHIDLSTWTAIGDFTDLMDHARNRDGDVHITDGTDTLIIENARKHHLAEADFIFA